MEARYMVRVVCVFSSWIDTHIMTMVELISIGVFGGEKKHEDFSLRFSGWMEYVRHPVRI